VSFYIDSVEDVTATAVLETFYKLMLIELIIIRNRENNKDLLNSMIMNVDYWLKNLDKRCSSILKAHEEFLQTFWDFRNIFSKKISRQNQDNIVAENYFWLKISQDCLNDRESFDNKIAEYSIFFKIILRLRNFFFEEDILTKSQHDYRRKIFLNKN
jgi:hypothetical protein